MRLEHDFPKLFEKLPIKAPSNKIKVFFVGCGITSETKEVDRILMLAIEAQMQQNLQLNKDKKRVIVLAGPTGCGKSDLGMSLAQVIGGEIISADSMQVYRGMNIGTAKPTLKDRETVPHHLIDIRDVNDPFNVVDYFYQARHACQIITDRDNTPIVIGGAGFYIHALMYGPPSGPPSVPEIRKSLDLECETLGVESMYIRLKQLDPEYANTITMHDKHKIVRGLEIIALTGKKVSKLSWKTRKQPQNYDFRCWFLYRPKETLYHRIEKRCDRMLLDGLIEEVMELDKLGLRTNLTASQAIGYKQCLEYLNTKQNMDCYRQLVNSFKQASRNYAKKQYTWFRKELSFRWLDLDLHDPEIAIDIIQRDYESWTWENKNT